MFWGESRDQKIIDAVIKDIKKNGTSDTTTKNTMFFGTTSKSTGPKVLVERNDNIIITKEISWSPSYENAFESKNDPVKPEGMPIAKLYCSIPKNIGFQNDLPLLENKNLSDGVDQQLQLKPHHDAASTNTNSSNCGAPDRLFNKDRILENGSFIDSSSFDLESATIFSENQNLEDSTKQQSESDENNSTDEEKSDPFSTDSSSSYSEESDEDTGDSVEENVQLKKKKSTRKRKRNERDWKVNKRKAARAAGREYKTKKNKVVKAKSLKAPCGCRKKCYEKFSHEERLRFFNDFYSLSYNEQTQFLAVSVVEHEKLRRTKAGADSRRTYTRTYYLKKSDKSIEVCKTMFLNTLDIGFKRLRYTVEKCRSGSGICISDQRGSHGNHRKISDEDRDIVIQHISKFPAYKSHYSRSHSDKRYLSPDLSIEQMYRLYAKYCQELGTTPVSNYFYREVFVSNFNISFHPPQIDTCGKCDKLEVLIKACSDEGEKINYEREKIKHVDAADRAYKEKRKDKEISMKNDNVVTAMFDLEKCLPTPHLKSGIAFYKRQLWVFNLTIYEVSSINNNKSYCFLWDETTAGRGGQEIASCLLKYIKNLPSTTTCLNLYSDCCSGQNKNIYVTTMLCTIFQYLPPDHKLEQINHKFLVSGHTHLEADSIHASIEKAKKHTVMEIEMPRDWSTLIKNVQRKGGINVIDMTQDDFFNIKLLQKAVFVNRKKNTDGEQMHFLKANYFRYNKNSPGKIFYKNSFLEEEEFKIWDISKKKKGQGRHNEASTPLQKLHDSYPLPISKKKLNDIQSLFCYIHPNSRLFYMHLKATDENDADDVCPAGPIDYDE